MYVFIDVKDVENGLSIEVMFTQIQTSLNVNMINLEILKYN